MNTPQLNLLLADDDADDCMLFKEALDELHMPVHFSTVNDGVRLMQLLNETNEKIPDVLFLDLNMPRKNGADCLSEIKKDEKLKQLPVIIYSTSLDQNVVNILYEKGAQYYIRKPGEFSKLKKIIFEALTIAAQSNWTKPPKDKFVIQV